MTAPDLPAELKAALDARLQGLSRNDAAERASLISQTYRDGGGSSAIRSEADALAYALARMPATYAAMSASLNALHEIRPDLAPTSLALLDSNSALRALALDLAGDRTRLRKITYQLGEARAALADSEAVDLVIASYMIGEIGDAERTALAELMWAKTRDTLLIVEPGTPAGYGRIIALRRQLIAAGANVAAPCPHDRECPLPAPDWCHFTQRLPRSRAHKHLKSAELPYEDEKFSYVALTRAPVAQHPARVLAQPVVTKIAVTARLCTDRGILNLVTPRRQKPAYQRFRKIAWGDAIFGADHDQVE